MTTATKYKTYPTYKPSGIDWLGDIPTGWEVWKYGHLFLTSMGETILREDLVDDGKIPVYSATEENINFGYVDSASVILDKGDLVIPARGNSIGNVKLVDKLSTTTQTTIYSKLIKKNKTDIRYVLYLLKGLKDVYFFFDRTAIPQITVNQVQNNDLCIPPIEDQKSIADFLDRETAKIDEMVAKKQKMIELLKEKRQALITYAVTKGLDPKAKMKPSGIDWLGDIPEGWEVRRIKMLCKVSRGASPRPIDDEKYFDDNGEYSWVRIADLTASDRYLDITRQKLSNLGKSLSVPLEPGEIFLSIAGTVGSPIITKIKCCIHDGFVYFMNLKYNRELLWYIFIAGEAYKGLGKLGTQLNLNTDTVGNISIPIMSAREQNQIVAFLDRETAKIDEMMKKVETQIEKLQEYRQALITSAVTGKIMVN